MLHVRIVAPLERRIEQVSRAEGLSADAAHALVERRDKASADYLARFYHADVSDPTLYDLVVNTATFAPPVAADLIVKAVEVMAAKA